MLFDDRPRSGATSSKAIFRRSATASPVVSFHLPIERTISFTQNRAIAKVDRETSGAEKVLALDDDALHARTVFVAVIQSVENSEGPLTAAHEVLRGPTEAWIR